MSTHTKRLGFLAFAFVLVLAGCDSNDTTNGGEDFDLTPALENVASNVIFATYTDLDEAAGILQTRVATFAEARTEANLTAARTAWMATRVPWESSESFLFGPVDTEGLDPALDSWPVNEIDLRAVLSSNATLTTDFVTSLPDEQKGFHTIEFLLFGDDGSKTPDAFTDREIDYLLASTVALEASAAALAAAWNPSAGNFIANLAQAGSSGSIYVSEKAAFQEYVNGMLVIADEVGNGKINDPLAAQDASLVESRFSRNSINDFQNNIRSIQHIYTGDYGGQNGAGVSDLIASIDPDLNVRFQQEVSDAIAAIGAIPGSFRDAIFDNRSAVEAAQQAVRQVQQTLEQDIAPLVSNL